MGIKSCSLMIFKEMLQTMDRINPLLFFRLLFMYWILLHLNTEALDVGKDSDAGTFCISGVQKQSCEGEKSKRYLLYDVNPSEGFNLRRDIYVRIAPLVHSLNQKGKEFQWILVLPPWGMLPHWKKTNPSTYYPWNTFFDLQIIKEYIPVLEYDEYLEEYGLDNSIDMIYQLQHFPFNKSETWKEKIEIGVVCESSSRYRRDSENGLMVGNYWDENVYAKNASCMALRGQASTLSKLLLKSKFRSVLFDKAEVILWDNYGGISWWTARKSLKFANILTRTSHDFLAAVNLTVSKPLNVNLSRSQYISAHLRRSDFLHGRRNLPTIQGAAKELVKIATRLHISAIFIASDASSKEIDALKSTITSMTKSMQIVQYNCPPDMTEGQCAIIDQILCSLAMYFIGTEESTFTLRIFEEREIMGFDPQSTFNYICSDEVLNCKKATQWRLK